MSAERCPVCGGAGKIAKVTNSGSTCPNIEEVCHGCGGKGWVETYASPYWPIYRDPCDGCPHKKPWTITYYG